MPHFPTPHQSHSTNFSRRQCNFLPGIPQKPPNYSPCFHICTPPPSTQFFSQQPEYWVQRAIQVTSLLLKTFQGLPNPIGMKSKVLSKDPWGPRWSVPDFLSDFIFYSPLPSSPRFQPQWLFSLYLSRKKIILSPWPLSQLLPRLDCCSFWSLCDCLFLRTSVTVQCPLLRFSLTQSSPISYSLYLTIHSVFSEHYSWLESSHSPAYVYIICLLSPDYTFDESRDLGFLAYCCNHRA